MALMLAACSDASSAAEVLECLSGETIDSAVVVAKGPDVEQVASAALTQSLGQAPDAVVAEGRLFVAVVDGRRIAVAEPVRSGDSYTVDQIDLCRPG